MGFGEVPRDENTSSPRIAVYCRLLIGVNKFCGFVPSADAVTIGIEYNGAQVGLTYSSIDITVL